MDLLEYKKRRESLLLETPRYRHLCTRCLQPEFGCYCAHIQSFDPALRIVILIHPIEVRRRIATGRMSHLCLQGSEMIAAQDYSDNREVNRILEDPRNQPMVLYPGPQSFNLTHANSAEKAALFETGKKPVIFVIDGTWATAKKTMHLSRNLKTLPRIAFTPPGRSRFRVRKQPGVDCYSTIEAIHHLIELLGDREGFPIQERRHDRLLRVFDKMVERQLDFIRDAYENPKSTSYRRPRRPPETGL